MPLTIALPLLNRQEEEYTSLPDGILPLTSGKSCGTGCDTHNGEKHKGHDRSFGKSWPVIQMPFSKRRLNFDAIPSRGMMVTTIDMDLTVECNLRCTYCFKEKWNEHMEEQVAFDAIVWLIHASGPGNDCFVSFMGGEPLLRFKLIKKLVPFAKRRAVQHGKKIDFGITTNGTLVTDEVVRFWREWDIGFHTSIDGTPDIQDHNRPTTSGKGSSRLVEKSSKRILAYRRNTTARSTVMPDTAAAMVRSYHYFRSIGYEHIAFVPGAAPEWDADSIRVYEEQAWQLADLVMDELRADRRVVLKGLDDYAESMVRGFRYSHPCGAGRGTVLIDIHGDIWPCHRWNKKTEESWRIGSIYEQFNDAARDPLNVPSFADRLENDCANCPANHMCQGGCPAENLEDTGSVYRRHSNACELTRVWARVGRHVYDTMMAEQNQTFIDNYCNDPDVPPD